MKKLLFTLAICYTASLFAQQKNLQHIATQLTNATIHYGYGAELNHTAKVNLGAGLQEIVLTNVATDIDPNTIQVGCPESIVLMSYRFNVKTEAEPKTKTPQLEKMNDTLKLFQKQQAALYNETLSAGKSKWTVCPLCDHSLAYDHDSTTVAGYIDKYFSLYY